MAGMTDPNKLIGFFAPLYYSWDPSMMLVFFGALAVNIPFFSVHFE